MARKAPAPKPVEPEDESQEVPEEPAASVIEPAVADAVSVTKAEAIRRARAEGLAATGEALPFIKRQFGLDVSPGHFAASKSREEPPGAPARERPRRGRPPVKARLGSEPKAAAARYLGSLPKPPAGRGDTDLLAAMEAMKPLVASLGAERVKRLVDLLG